MKLTLNALAFLPSLLVLPYTPTALGKEVNGNVKIVIKSTITKLPGNKLTSAGSGLYFSWNLQSSGLSQDAFEQGVKGYNYLLRHNNIKKSNLFTIIDYSRPSTKKRLFVLDMLSGEIVFNTLVAHGQNSGYNYATQFSNEAESHKTSLGFYITLETYTGTNGYSLKLKGCEKGINDKAYERAIVLHGADYVNEAFIQNKGYLGRSYGCPALPLALHKKIIDKIKNGSCVFLYHPTKKYSIRSKILDS